MCNNQSKAESENDEEYNLFPVCHLFNEKQVEPLGSDFDNKLLTDKVGDNETIESQAEPKEEFQVISNPFVRSDYVEHLDARKERLEDRAGKANKESVSLYNKAKQMADVIPFGQPILVGHHSEARDRRYRSKIHNTFGKAFEMSDKAEYLANKAKSIGTGGIASDDPEALIKLNKKLDGLVDSQEKMKAANKLVKKNDLNGLINIGFSEKQAQELLTGDFMGRKGFASYALQNNNAEINRIKKRIKALESLQTVEPVSFENDDFKAYFDEGKARFDFIGGKPSEEVRAILKSNGFKWSRYSGEWVRKATMNCIRATEYIIEKLKEVDSIY